jgi:hypothetical protein
VPDGIAQVVASVSAMNNYVPIQQDHQGNVLECNININTADRNQLAVYLAAMYPDLGPAAANEIVVRVIELRSRKQAGRAFGITEQEFEQIIHQYA